MPILLVKVNTSNVPDSPARWRAGEVVAAVADDHEFGNAELPTAGNFYHISITDKTLEEVKEYLEAWTHNPTVEQVSAQGNNRLIEVTSSMVSATGKNAFTQSGVQALFDEINSLYPTAEATYDSHTDTSFRFTIKAPREARDEIIALTNEHVRSMQYARRRWYIVSSGMNFLANNGGVVSGTAQQVGGYLRDGLLD